MATENAYQRFKEAVGILVDEKNNVKERLMIAYISQLSRIDSHRELPEKSASVFDGIRLELTIDEVPGDRGTVSKALEKISDDEASRIARQVFDIFLELNESKSRND